MPSYVAQTRLLLEELTQLHLSHELHLLYTELLEIRGASCLLSLSTVTAEYLDLNHHECSWACD